MKKIRRKARPISIPALRGRIGDWYYYLTLMSCKEVANRVSLPEEIDEYEHEDMKLGEWIQRELEEKRINDIVNYLTRQKQRFFNSLILGIYGGKPYWQDLEITVSQNYPTLNEETLSYLTRTFGILTLNGDESIFAIDGQHRAKGIREALKSKRKLAEEEVPSIFVAHKTDEAGIVRTRRLFSTLNRYAKPVTKKEIIILSEDDNCAIVTRDLIENFDLLKKKVLIHASRVIRPENKTAFTNIILLYEIVERLLTDKKVLGFKVHGKDHKSFTSQRAEKAVINNRKQYVKRTISEVADEIPSYKTFFESGSVDRTKKSTSLLFRPIGQNILFDVIKIAINHSKKKAALGFFAKDNFNLRNAIWKKVFWDDETETLSTEKSKQRYATLLILENLGIAFKRTKKDQEIYDNYSINADQL